MPAVKTRAGSNRQQHRRNNLHAWHRPQTTATASIISTTATGTLLLFDAAAAAAPAAITVVFFKWAGNTLYFLGGLALYTMHVVSRLEGWKR